MQYIRLFMLVRWLFKRRFWLSSAVIAEGALRIYRKQQKRQKNRAKKSD